MLLSRMGRVCSTVALGGLLTLSDGLVANRMVLAEELPPLVEGSTWLRRWDGVTINMSTYTGPNAVSAAEIVKEFETLTGAKVNVIAESWADLLAKHLADAAAGGGAYDVLTWPYLWSGHYIEGGLAENLDTWLAQTDLVDPNLGLDDIPPAIMEVYGHYRGPGSPDPDALWALPYVFDIYLAQWRPSMFKEAGLVDADGNPRPPDTWEQLLADAKALKATFPDMQPLAIPLQVDDPTVSTFLPILASYSGNVPIPWYGNDLFPIFQEQPGIDAATVLKALVEYMPPDALSMDYDRVNGHMSQGLAAYAINWNAYLPVLLDPQSSSIHDDVAFAPTPGGPAGQASGLGGWAMAVSSQSKNKAAAFQLIQWIGGKDRAVQLAMAGGSLARFSVAQNADVVAKYPYYPLLIKALEGYSARGMDRSWTDVQRLIGVGLSKILLGEVEVKQGLVQTAGEVFDAVQRAGYTPENGGARPN